MRVCLCACSVRMRCSCSCAHAHIHAFIRLCMLTGSSQTASAQAHMGICMHASAHRHTGAHTHPCPHPMHSPHSLHAQEPVAFWGGIFAGNLGLNLEEEPLRSWVERTTEVGGHRGVRLAVVRARWGPMQSRAGQERGTGWLCADYLGSPRSH